jgi:sirohydrochlorin ferrochelatase
MNRSLCGLAAGLVLALPGSVQAAERVGVLVLAHGGENRWNAAVHHAVRQAKLDAPTEVAFGMGMHGAELRGFQQAVNRLERKGISRIIVVPLLVSSYSEVYRQYEYVLGLRPQAEWPEAGRPLSLEVPVTLASGLDDDPLVAEILLERAQQLSRQAAEETVVLVAHGPVQEADQQVWTAHMEQMARWIQQQGGFRSVVARTLRDDAPRAVKEQAAAALREAVAGATQHGRALVVPLLLAQGGVEHKIPKLLTGLTYRYNGHTLLPHDKLVQWIVRQASRLHAAVSRQS